MIMDRGAKKWTAMILPEHRKWLERYAIEINKRSKPLYDEQHIEEVARMVRDYINSEVYLCIVVFHEYNDIEYYARITKFDPQLKRIKIENDQECVWISVFDIVDIYV